MKYFKNYLLFTSLVVGSPIFANIAFAATDAGSGKVDSSKTIDAKQKPSVGQKNIAAASKSAKKDDEAGKEKAGEEGSKPDEYFAIIDGREIPLDVFRYEFRRGVKQTFYHGKVADKELEDYRKKKVNQLILGTLLALEAERRGLKIPKNVIKKKLDALEKKNKNSKNWDKNKEAVFKIVSVNFETEELVKLLKDEVVNIKEPGSSKVEEYYSDNIDQFTAPEQWRVSLIMLLVDPSSPGTVWDESLEKAAELVERIREGDSFAEFARIHSGDPSAVDGGDMGYMHIGMLAKPAQEVLNIMRVGEVSEPVMLLKGIAIFRLDGVQAPRENKFTTVKDRASDLLVRQQGKDHWLELKKKLKASKKVVVNSELAKYYSTEVLVVGKSEDGSNVAK